MVRTRFHIPLACLRGDRRSRAEERWAQQGGLRPRPGQRLPLTATSSLPPCSWGVEGGWAPVSWVLHPFFPGCSWLFQGRALAPSRWPPQSSLRALPVQVDGLVWPGCRVSAVSRVLAVVLSLKGGCLEMSRSGLPPAAFGGMWCVSRCVWVSGQY